MRNAPAVSAPLDAGRPERVLIVLLYALAAAVLAFWAQVLLMISASAPVWLSAASGIAAAAAVGLVLARRALPSDGDQLRWDGQAWTLQIRRSDKGRVATHPIPLVSVWIKLDAGAWLLLRLQPGSGKPRWQVARAACVGPAWHALRVALFAHSGWAADAPTASPAAIAPPRRSA